MTASVLKKIQTHEKGQQNAVYWNKTNYSLKPTGLQAPQVRVELEGNVIVTNKINNKALIREVSGRSL